MKLQFLIVNLLSSMLTVAVVGFNMAALSVDVSVRLKNSVSSSTLSSRIGTVTICVETVGPNVRVMVTSA